MFLFSSAGMRLVCIFFNPTLHIYRFEIVTIFFRNFDTCSGLPFVVNYALFLIYVNSVKTTLIYTIASVIRHRLSSVDLVVG